MKSFTALKKMFTDLSQNSTTTNNTLGGTLINDQHRYLILKYFDNERYFTMTTIGPQTLAFSPTSGTTAIVNGGTNATLSTAWPSTSITCQQLVVFTNSDQRLATFTQGSTQVTWQSPLSSSAGTTATLTGVQSYPLPANISKIKNSTITIGQLVYTPAPVQSIQEWTKLNALPYTAAYPAYFFVYGGQIQFWPIPSTTGYIIGLYGQINVPDLTYEDYTTGTIATGGMSVGSNIIACSGSSFTGTFPANTDLTFANLYFTAVPPNGDGIPYPIQKFTSATSATLSKPVVNAPNVSGGSILIGQYPLLDPNFHDAIVYGALRIYFNSIVKDPDRYALYDRLFGEKTQLMEGYLSTKQVNVDLSITPTQTNPNLYIFGT